jgi:hypothetical protein
MKRSTFLTIASLIGIIFGLIIGLYPKDILEPNGLVLDSDEHILARALAASILSVSIGIWFSRNAPASAAMKGILWIVLLMHFSSMIVDLYYYSKGYLTSAVFGSSALHLLIGAGALYYLVRMQPETEPMGEKPLTTPA